MNSASLKRFYINLGSVIKCTPDEAAQLVTNFNTGTFEFFEGFFANLPTAKLARNSTRKNNVNTTLFIRNNKGARGYYGEVTRNRNGPFVYKLTREKNVNTELERLNYLKMIFKEVIIQCLLMSDDVYGDKVCKIYSVYRIGQDCVFKLEALQMTLKDAGNLRNDSDLNSNSEQIRKFLIELFQILVHFRNRYGFQHLDLHTENIMTNPDLTDIKMIYFGLSTVTIEGQKIGSGTGWSDGYNITSFVLYFKLSKAFSKTLSDLAVLDDDTGPEAYLEGLIAGPYTNVALKAGRRKTRRSLSSI
jgi:hypothetical protein